VMRATQGQGLDVPYLVSLSSDIVPVLVSEFKDQSLPGLTRDAVGAVLVCRLQTPDRVSDKDWRSFTIAKWMEKNALKSIQNELSDYQVTTPDGLPQMVTPGHVFYKCYQNQY